MIDAIDGYLHSLSLDDRLELGGLYPELAALLPALGTMREQRAVGWVPDLSGAAIERGRLFAALARFLGDLGQERSVLLVLDDLHAADAATHDLFNHLVHTGVQQILVLGTYRREDAPADSSFQRVLAAAQHDNLTQSVGLLRLSQRDSAQVVAALTGGEASSDLTERIWGLSLGNPLMIRELVETMRAEGMLIQTGGGWKLRTGTDIVVPRTLQDTLRVRMGQYGPAVAEILNLAAVHGMEISYRLLRRAASLDEAAILDALDTALQGRLLQEHGDSYAFQHPLVRHALLQLLSSARLSHLHGRLGLAMEIEYPAEVEVLAYHFERSGEDQKAVTYLERAGDRASQVYAHEAAEAYYRRLLARLEGGTDTARIQEKLGAVLATLARYDEALALLDEALAVQQAAGNWERVGAIAAHIAGIYSTTGRLNEGTKRIADFLTELGDKNLPGVVIRLRIARAYILFDSGTYLEAASEATVAMEEAQLLGDEQARALAGLLVGVSLASAGRPMEAVGHIQESITLARQIDDPDSLSLGLFLQATGAMLSGQSRLGLTIVEEAVAVARRLGDPVRIGLTIGYRGIAEFNLGLWDAALDDLTEGMERISPAAARLAPYARIWLGELEIARGYWEDAVVHLQQAIAACEEGNLLGVRLAHRVLGELDILRGRPNSAIARIEPLLDEGGREDQGVSAVLPILAWAYLEAGNMTRAEDVAVEAERRARASFPMYLPNALRVKGLIRRAQEQQEEATAALEEAIALARALECPYDEARALHARADLAAEQHDTSSILLLEQAIEIYRRLKARPGLERAEETLNACRTARSRSRARNGAPTERLVHNPSTST